MTSTSATTVTINNGLFAAGDTVFIQNLGTGACTITAGSATVATAGSLILPQNDAGILYFVSASSSVFYDYIQAGAVSPLTTKGDVYTFSTSDARLAVGANNTTLVADSAEATGLKYAASLQSTLTTTGDSIYASAANTPARLGIGSTGQVLTVASGLPSWATPSASAPTVSSDKENASNAVQTTSTSYTSGSPAAAVTLTTGTKALVWLRTDCARSQSNRTFIHFAVSGASSVSATDNDAMQLQLNSGVSWDNNSFFMCSGQYYVSGLTAGSNTFTMQFKTSSGTTYLNSREITVMDLGS
jgi:hypothetical protein